MTIVESFDDPLGKFPNTFGNLMVLDQNYFIELIMDMITTLLRDLTLTIVPQAPALMVDFVEDAFMRNDLLLSAANIKLEDYAFIIESVFND